MPPVYHSRQSSSSASSAISSIRSARAPPPSPMSSISSLPQTETQRPSLSTDAPGDAEVGARPVSAPASAIAAGAQRTSDKGGRSIGRGGTQSAQAASAGLDIGAGTEAAESQPMARGSSDAARAQRPARRFFIPDSTGSSPSIPAHDTNAALLHPARPGSTALGRGSMHVAAGANIDPLDRPTGDQASGETVPHPPTHSRRVSEHYQQHNPAPPFWRNVDSQFSLDLGDYGTGEYSSRSSSISESSGDGGDAQALTMGGRRSHHERSTVGTGADAGHGPSTPPRRYTRGARPSGSPSRSRSKNQNRRRAERPADIVVPNLRSAFDPDFNPFHSLAQAQAAGLLNDHPPSTEREGVMSPHTPIRYGQPRAFYTTTNSHSVTASPSPFTISRMGADGKAVEVSANLGMPGLPPHMYEVLLDIHQTLYCGQAYVQGTLGGSGERGREIFNGTGQKSWTKRVKEVRGVVERCLEGDCVYDHPLIRVTSRDALLSHFILLHLAASAYLPSLTPSALLHHAMTSAGFSLQLARNLVFGRSNVASDTSAPSPRNLEKGKRPAHPLHLDEKKRVSEDPYEAAEASGLLGQLLRSAGSWYGLSHPTGPGSQRQHQQQANPTGWWHLWEINADCKEIGGMECYDGIHLAMIEQVITLTILPSLLAPSRCRTLSEPSSVHSLDLDALREDASPLAPAAQTAAARRASASGTSGSDTFLPLPIQTHSPSPGAGFIGKLAGAIAREFEYLLRWELPISTMVEFNEVGKATRIRDVVDIQDLVETFVPFAKRFSWLTRSLNGLVSSAVGGLILGASAVGAGKHKGDQEKENRNQERQGGMGPIDEKRGLMVPIALDSVSGAH